MWKGKIMVHVKFKYRDQLSGWEWREQECTVSSVDQCISIYGLNQGDVEYEILSVTQLPTNK